MKRILVYGATGSQGSPVARRLLASGHHIRVLTRNPGGAEALRRAGAEIVRGDMADLESLQRASEGMEAVFLLVPFFTDTPGDGLVYAKNAIDAARAAGVELLVLNASGEIAPVRTGNPGFDLRLDVLDHLKASGLPHVVLQPTAYMENFLGPWTLQELAERDVFAYPTPNEVQMQWVATEDVAAFAVYALEHPELADLNIKVAGPERLNGEGIAARFSNALGRTITFRPMPPEEFGEKLDRVFPGMGGPAAQGYAMAYRNPQMFSSNVDTGAALAKMPVPLTTLERWVSEHQDTFRAAAVR